MKAYILQPTGVDYPTYKEVIGEDKHDEPQEKKSQLATPTNQKIPI